MIATLHGEVAAIGEQYLVVQVGGVGIMVHVPPLLAKSLVVGERIFLHTSLIVREDSLTMYGFEDPQEKDFFELFLSVNGVGPRTALAAISTLSIDLIRRAVVSEQPEIFNQIPGVGKKGAQKIMLHLQGKVDTLSPIEASKTIDVDMEVMEALTSLGYSVIEAQSALQYIPRDAPHDIEERLRIALSYFAR